MKLTLLALVLLTVTAHANQQLPKPLPRAYGEQCGFPSSSDNEDDVDVTPSITIEAGVSLKDIEQAQVIAAVQAYAGEMQEAGPGSIEEAIAYLVEGSEGGEVYLQTVKVNGVTYDRLEWYPGGNPYGIYFKQGTTVDVAHIEDSDIICTQFKLRIGRALLSASADFK